MRSALVGALAAVTAGGAISGCNPKAGRACTSNADCADTEACLVTNGAGECITRPTDRDAGVLEEDEPPPDGGEGEGEEGEGEGEGEPDAGFPDGLTGAVLPGAGHAVGQSHSIRGHLRATPPAPVSQNAAGTVTLSHER
jgi:hypothetical protein